MASIVKGYNVSKPEFVNKSIASEIKSMGDEVSLINDKHEELLKLWNESNEETKILLKSIFDSMTAESTMNNERVNIITHYLDQKTNEEINIIISKLNDMIQKEEYRGIELMNMICGSNQEVLEETKTKLDGISMELKHDINDTSLSVNRIKMSLIPLYLFIISNCGVLIYILTQL